MKHGFIAYLLVVAIVFSTCALMPQPVAADATSQWWTYYPGALNASSARIAPSPTSPISNDLIKIRGDGFDWQFYESYEHVELIETNDFIEDEEWYQPDPPLDKNYIVGYPPPDNATIISVSLVVVFQTYVPGGQISFSIDDKGNWTVKTVPSTYYSYQVNVTAYADWTPQILKSDETWVRGVFSCDASTFYWVDYIGFIIHWLAPYGGGYDEVYVPPTVPDLDYITEFGMMGILGFLGFGGMIALPAAGIWIHKQGGGGDRIVLFVNMLAAWVFCFAMFLVSVY